MTRETRHRLRCSGCGDLTAWMPRLGKFEMQAIGWHIIDRKHFCSICAAPIKARRDLARTVSDATFGARVIAGESIKSLSAEFSMPMHKISAAVRRWAAGQPWSSEIERLRTYEIQGFGIARREWLYAARMAFSEHKKGI